MARFFFNFVLGSERIADVHGVELDGVRAAHWHAVQLARKVARLQVNRPGQARWVIQVTDRHHRPEVTVLLPVAWRALVDPGLAGPQPDLAHEAEAERECMTQP